MEGLMNVASYICNIFSKEYECPKRWEQSLPF